MKNTIIVKVAGFVAGASMLAVAAPAMAASFTNVEFQNGDVTVQGSGGSTVNATFRVVIGPGEVVEKIQTDVTSDGLAPVCTDVGGSLGLQEGTHNITLPIKLPPNTGTYTLNVQGSGIFGGFATVDCTSNVVGSASFGSALKVVANGSSTGDLGGDEPSWLAALMALLTKLTGNDTTPPATNAKCTELNAKLVGTMDNTYNDANVRLQGFLLSEGASIPALKAGASFGYKGNQTNSAISWFKATNQCN